jgi:hypothetical protein
MANTDKDILITPNVGSSSADPKIEFKGADASTSAQTITATAYPTNNGTLSFDGSAGQLFSITNDMTGTIFSVNDVSGIPSIEVDDDGTIRFAEYSGNVGIGEASPSYKLHVNGGLTTTVYATGDGGTSSYAEFVAYNPDDGAGHAGATVRLRSYGWGEGYVSVGGFNIMQQGGRMNINNSGQTLYINASNVGIGDTSPSQKFTVSQNTDTSAVIGRAHVGYVGWADYAGFSHMDADGTGSYALLANASGGSYLNAASGQVIELRNNNISIGNISSSGLTISNVDVSGNVQIGSEVVLQESTDRADLLQITSTTSGWGGLQIRNSNNEGRWSFMTDGETAGIYNDEDNQWQIYMVESAGTYLYYNGASKINTQSWGATVTGTLVAGAVEIDGQLDIEEVHEKVTTDTTTTGTYTFDTSAQGIVYFTADQTANRTINFSNVNSSISFAGQSVTCTVLLTNGTTPYYLNAYQVDGTAVTPKWAGGSAPSGGTASGIDTYTFTIIKTADATFTVLASLTSFS